MGVQDSSMKVKIPADSYIYNFLNYFLLLFLLGKTKKGKILETLKFCFHVSQRNSSISYMRHFILTAFKMKLLRFHFEAILSTAEENQKAFTAHLN